MDEKYIIKIYSPALNMGWVYYQSIIGYNVPSEDLLNYTEDINKATTFKDKDTAIKQKDYIKTYFNHTDETIIIKDITKYTKYTRFEIMDI